MHEPIDRRLDKALSELIHTQPVEGESLRVTAVRTLVDLHLEAARQGAAPPAHFAELMAGLLPRLSLEARSDAARRLAHCPALPVEIAALFLADDYAVAGPVLRQSPLLPDEALLSVASGPCADKARAVAGRSGLSPAVVAALLARGDGAIAAILAATQDHLDGEEASRIALCPKLPPRAAERLSEICGISNTALAALFWKVGAPARRRILDRLSKRCLGLAPDEALAPPPEADPELGTRLVRLAAEKRRLEIADILARVLGLPESLALRIVEDPGGEPLALAGRATGLASEHITGLVLLTAPKARIDLGTLRELVALAGTADSALALYLTTLWARAEAAGESPEEAARAPARGAIRHEPAIAPPSTRRQQEAQNPLRELERLIRRSAGDGA